MNNLSEGENLKTAVSSIIEDLQTPMILFNVIDINIYDPLYIDATNYYIIEIFYYGIVYEEINRDYPLQHLKLYNMKSIEIYHQQPASIEASTFLSLFLFVCRCIRMTRL
jgi:hypothetical protein